ncbi:MAG: TraC family protein [Candidatus Magasanikiibacteriota bacterium]
MSNEKVKKKKNSHPSTQTHLPIAEIKDGVVILKDGTLRAVLMTSSVNFALKSEDEQNALISAYVSFLNSINFPLQIVSQSRKLQIKPYIEKLLNLEKAQTNELLRVQTADYRAFIQELVEIGEIMTKRFYVIVPYDPMSNSKKSFWSRFKGVLKPALTVRLKEERFKQRKDDLDIRVRQVIGGLQGMGVEAVQLDTQSLIELYYATYNPDISFSEGLQPVKDLRIEDI